MSEFVFSRKPIEIERGEGVKLVGTDGTEYLDAGASYACTPLGHSHPTVHQAVSEQISSLTYVQGSYPTASRDALVETLSNVAPGTCSNVWLCNSGTEANEAALKFARSATDSDGIVACRRGFHGRTMGALSATWRPAYREPFEPLVPGVDFVTYNDIEALTETVESDTAAIIIEPIQGEGGVHPATPEFLTAARELANDVNAALIIDEIQTGLGRTGTFWAIEEAGVEPDIVTVAKGIANGLPMGATLCQEWIAENAGPHGSTFSGNPVASAAANATIHTIQDDELAAHAAALGERIRAEIRAADLPIRAVRGQGLMIGIEVKRGANRVLRDLALEQQVLALPAGRSVLRLLPPLILDESNAERLVKAICSTLAPGEQ